MPYRMNEKQFEAVLALDSFKRFDHFIGKVATGNKRGALKVTKVG
ncbi:hypothetical protein V6D52_04445 [Idiomarina loihiensis]